MATAADGYEAPVLPPVSGRIDADEREAVAIELDGVPKVYARAFAAIQANPPSDVPTDRWQRFIDDAGRFLDEHGSKAEKLGWSVAELFGLHLMAPMARYEVMGLCWLMNGTRVTSLTSTKARFSDGLTTQAWQALGRLVRREKHCRKTGALVAAVLGKRCGTSRSLNEKTRKAFWMTKTNQLSKKGTDGPPENNQKIAS